MIPKTIVHLLSGGLDSVTLLYDLHGQGHSVHCLLVDYQQRHKQELEFAIGHCRRLNVLWTRLEIPALGGMTDDNWIVPNRNAILIALAVNLAVRSGAQTVTIGCNEGDAHMFPDCNGGFIRAMEAATREAGYEIEICAPYLDWQKWRIAGLAREMGVPLHEIWTCYRGGVKPCGECPACKKLNEALE